MIVAFISMIILNAKRINAKRMESRKSRQSSLMTLLVLPPLSLPFVFPVVFVAELEFGLQSDLVAVDGARVSLCSPLPALPTRTMFSELALLWW